MYLLFVIGLSPDLQTMEQIRRIMRPTDVPDTGLLLNFRYLVLIPASVRTLLPRPCHTLLTSGGNISSAEDCHKPFCFPYLFLKCSKCWFMLSLSPVVRIKPMMCLEILVGFNFSSTWVLFCWSSFAGCIFYEPYYE